jgi:nitrous oxidase accessory protein
VRVAQRIRRACAFRVQARIAEARGGAAVLALMLALPPGASDAAAPPSPERPEDCVSVAAGDDLQARLVGASPGARFCLEAGEYAGPIRFDRPATVWGPREAVVRSHGSGSTVMIEASGSALLGVTVDGSGGRFDLLDAAVRIHADDVRVEGVRVQNALFGVLAERSNRVLLRANEIQGAPGKVLGMRGDGIRLWEVRASQIERNRILDSRDLVVWYSPDNRFVANVIERGRYGTHFMYSHRNVIERCRYRGNVVAIFSMYSRDLEIRGNLLAEATGAAGVGLGAKESGNLVVEDNWIVANTTGIYLDTTPLDPADHDRFVGNVVRFSDAAVIFHGPAARNHFEANLFADNEAQVRVEGRGDATDAEWRGNTWDDYAGYDLDGDGRGDVAYSVRSLSSDLVARVPALAWFRGSVALALVDLVGRAVPLFESTTVLVDPAPRMSAPLPEPPDAG